MRETLNELLESIENSSAFAKRDYYVGKIRKGIENHKIHYTTMRSSHFFLTDAPLHVLQELYDSLEDCPENMIDAEISKYLRGEEYEMIWDTTVHYHIGYSLDKYILNFRDCVK